MKWENKSKYHIASGIFSICKIYMSGKPRYELWKREKGKPEFIATGNLDELKQMAREM
jgi:hypothetical protein